MDLAYFLSRGWDFIQWLASTVMGTVANSILGGWTAVLIMAGIAFVLFLITSLFFRRRSDD
jgi:hypothetical protein